MITRTPPSGAVEIVTSQNFSPFERAEPLARGDHRGDGPVVGASLTSGRTAERTNPADHPEIDRPTLL